MIIWDRRERYRFLSPDDRKDVLSYIGSKPLVNILTTFSVLLNILVPVFLYFYFGFNLILFGIVFIGMDIILNLFEQIFFITIPYLKSKTKNISVVDRRISRLERKRAKILIRFDNFKDKHCDGCSREYVWDHYNCDRCSEMEDILDKKEKIEEIIEREKKYLIQLKERTKTKTSHNKVETKEMTNKHTNEKVKTVAVTETKTQNDDVLEEVVSKLNKYINENKYDFLIPLRKSISSVSSVLKSKPNGVILIPVAYWKKLDILMKTLPAVTEMDADAKTEYLDALRNVSREMGSEMQLYISDINKMSNAEGNMNIEELMKRLKEMEENTNA